MNFGSGVLIAVLLLVLPGAAVARAGGLRWMPALAVGPALTYGIVGLFIVPFGALGIPWSGWSAITAFLGVLDITLGARLLLTRQQRREGKRPTVRNRSTAELFAAAGVLVGAVAIGIAAWRGMPHWQSVPSTWDAVWHANTVRWILDTGQASPTHMGELRNVETHDALYYPSAFHALAAVFAQFTGAAPTTAYTLSSLAAAVWLFPASAALLTWQLLSGRTSRWRTAGASGTAAALSASFTAVPYVEFGTASMPNLTAYGIAVPTFFLVTSAVRHRGRIPLAVLALIGVFSVHITGGVVVVTMVAAWWLLDAVRTPIAGRGRDFAALLAIAVPTLAVLLPQFLGVLQQTEIITGHEFVTHEGKKRALFDALVQHTRHLNDFPIQNMIIGLAAAGMVLLLVRRIWWPVAVWALFVVAIVHSSAPFGGPVGAITGAYSNLFYSDPRRLSAVVTMLLTPMAGYALFVAVTVALGWVRRRTGGGGWVRRRTGGGGWVRRRTGGGGWVRRRTGGGGWVRRHTGRGNRRTWTAATAAMLTGVSVALAWHYFPRHRFLMGDKYDQVMVDNKDLAAFAHLASLPGARDTLIGNANVDGTAWMYAVADLHPLWTHYDYPVQQGPGYNRFIFWAFADDADTDPRVAEAVRALNIRYVITSKPVVRGFVMPDGLVSLDKSASWVKIYDNGEARIYEWRGR